VARVSLATLDQISTKVCATFQLRNRPAAGPRACASLHWCRLADDIVGHPTRITLLPAQDAITRYGQMSCDAARLGKVPRS